MKKKLQGIDEKTIVKDGQAIEVGKERKSSCLIVIHGQNLGKRYNIDDEKLVLGRSDDADIKIMDGNVSRKHAEVVAEGDKIIIHDLDSTNGTFVNTERLKKAILKDGNLILIGNTILKFISRGNIENAYHEEIYNLATLDTQTQAYNKRYFLERLNGEFSRSKRYKRDLSLTILDFDHFKRVNDTYGHLAGDFVLKRAASLILRNLRKEDVLGRYGGEEFAIILPETKESNCFNIADKMRVMIEKSEFEYGKKKIPVTISMGIAFYNGNSEKISTYNDLIEAADLSLYEAKNSGRNRVVSAHR